MAKAGSTIPRTGCPRNARTSRPMWRSCASGVDERRRVDDIGRETYSTSQRVCRNVPINRSAADEAASTVSEHGCGPRAAVGCCCAVGGRGVVASPSAPQPESGPTCYRASTGSAHPPTSSERTGPVARRRARRSSSDSDENRMTHRRASGSLLGRRSRSERPPGIASGGGSANSPAPSWGASRWAGRSSSLPDPEPSPPHSPISLPNLRPSSDAFVPDRHQ